MKTVKFKKEDKAIIVEACVKVDGIEWDYEFILDTGTQETLICEKTLWMMGYVRANSKDDVPIRTVCGEDTAYRYEIESIEALGVKRSKFDVIAYPMPGDAGVRGLLGVDFFEKTRLTIDFDSAEVSVEIKGSNLLPTTE